jgi:hypothetical protein
LGNGGSAGDALRAYASQTRLRVVGLFFLGARVFGLLWVWWDARSKANSGEKMLVMEEIVYRAQSINLDTSTNRQEKVFKPPTEKLHWCPPKSDFLTINFDGAFHISAKAELGVSSSGIRKDR